jgi:DNA-binding response OmpR family regulator
VTAVRPTGSRGIVIVADDEPALRFLCRINLEAEGYRVLEAGDASELGRILEAEGDVVALLLDIGLGADDGIEIARRLRSDRPGLPIAFFTGTALPLSDDVRALAGSVLPKPFTPELLSETVRRIAPS